MSVYIKGVEMPGNCGECVFCRAAIWKGKEYPCVCLARNIVVKPSETDMRDGLCPLILVPDHGDLIDRDMVVTRLAEWSNSLIETYGENDEYVKCLSEVLEGLGYYDVVIPAERSEE